MEFPCARIVADVRKCDPVIEDMMYDTREYDLVESFEGNNALRHIIRDVDATEMEILQYRLTNHPSVINKRVKREKKNHTEIVNYQVEMDLLPCKEIFNFENPRLDIIRDCCDGAINFISLLEEKILQAIN